MPAYYFHNGKEINEPEEAGLFIMPSNSNEFEKINASDKSTLLFQVGEFGQLLSHDRIKATKHMVKKSYAGIERYTLAVFYSAGDNTIIKSTSTLIDDARFQENKLPDGSINYAEWQRASYARYRAMKKS